jgi:hypothetical protein
VETFDEARETIYKELTADDLGVRIEFLKLFDFEANTFAAHMARAFINWRTFDESAKGDEAREMVSALIYCAITSHVLSFRLFFSGHIIAAGNLFRQVIEAIALAFLCSAGKQLDVLRRFMEDKYSSAIAVDQLLRNASRLSLKDDALQAFKRSQKFYHNYSHVSKATIAAVISFEQPGGLYVGASFDSGKIEAYRSEVEARVSLAQVFPNFVEGVSENVAKW